MRTSILDVLKVVQRMPVVFDLHSLSLALGKSKKATAVYVKKLIDKEFLYRVGRGLYSRVKDPVVVAGNLPFPSYITGPFALFYWGEGEAPYTIDVSTLEYKRSFKGWPIRFHRIRRLGRFTIGSYLGFKIKIATLEQAEKESRRFGLLD